jgi:hypothetical protein
MLSKPSRDLIEIVGINEPTIEKYFQTINQGDYQATAQLFTKEGILKAPFELPIAGKDEIVKYLTAEAKGMKLIPRQGNQESRQEELCLYQIQGKVKTSLFSVNVAWDFLLNRMSEIVEVKIKLLASPQELLKIRR